jgi:hypothetical protein
MNQSKNSADKQKNIYENLEPGHFGEYVALDAIKNGNAQNIYVNLDSVEIIESTGQSDNTKRGTNQTKANAIKATTMRQRETPAQKFIAPENATDFRRKTMSEAHSNPTYGITSRDSTSSTWKIPRSISRK